MLMRDLFAAANVPVFI